MRYIVFIVLLLFIAGCNSDVLDSPNMDMDVGVDEIFETGGHIEIVPEYAESYLEFSEEHAEEADNYTDNDVEANDMANNSETDENDVFEIHDILGTADSLYGERWNNMLAWREDAVLLANQYRDTVFINMNPNDNAVYLTFDDGPDPINTVSVINTLIEFNVSATFFFTGENMSRHSEVVQMAYDAGFAIGLHSYSHRHFTGLSEVEIIEELNVPNDILESITGSRSYIMRPPFGAADSREIEIIREQDYLVYLWSIDTLDWALDDAADILQNIKDYIRPGDIILMHAFSGQSRSAAILPEIIEFILSMGFDIKALPG